MTFHDPHLRFHFSHMAEVEQGTKVYMSVSNGSHLSQLCVPFLQPNPRTPVLPLILSSFVASPLLKDLGSKLQNNQSGPLFFPRWVCPCKVREKQRKVDETGQ